VDRFLNFFGFSIWSQHQSNSNKFKIKQKNFFAFFRKESATSLQIFTHPENTHLQFYSKSPPYIFFGALISLRALCQLSSSDTRPMFKPSNLGTRMWGLEPACDDDGS
jgi:hypothetical protein